MDMKHYLAVLVPRGDGGWRAHFPDFPGCRAEALSVEAAIDAAAAAAAEHARQLRAQGVSLPHPQTYEEVRHHSNGWAAERGVDWSHAVASVVKLPLEE
jgi:predicted RNase H-like HicB family nuclease